MNDAEMARLRAVAVVNPRRVDMVGSQIEIPVTPEPFEPTIEDIRNLAICLAAAHEDTCFSTAEELLALRQDQRTIWLRVARNAFDHPGYLPSIVRARQDAARGFSEPVTGYDTEYRALSDQLSDTLWELDLAREGRDISVETVDFLIDRNSALGATNERLRDEISALTAEKNALHDALAILGGDRSAGPSNPSAPPADPNAPPPNPYPLGPGGPLTTKGQVSGPPGHNPFREFGWDRRMMGR